MYTEKRASSHCDLTLVTHTVGVCTPSFSTFPFQPVPFQPERDEFEATLKLMRPEVLGAPDEAERDKRIGLFWTHIDKDVDHKVTLKELTKLTSKAIQHVTKGAPSWLVAGFMRVHGTSLERSERTGWFEGPVWKGGIMLRALKNKGNVLGGVTSPLRTIMANRVFQQTSNFFVLVAVGTFLAATATAHEKQRSFLLVIELVLFVFFFFEMVRVRGGEEM